MVDDGCGLPVIFIAFPSNWHGLSPKSERSQATQAYFCQPQPCQNVNVLDRELSPVRVLRFGRGHRCPLMSIYKEGYIAPVNIFEICIYIYVYVNCVYI